MSDVLDGAEASGRVFGLIVERTEIDCVISLFIQSVKSYAKEALLLNILALNIKLDAAVGELNPLQVCYAIARASIQPDTILSSVFETLRLRLKTLKPFLSASDARSGSMVFF
jgi:hypothetical protein